MNKVSQFISKVIIWIRRFLKPIAIVLTIGLPLFIYLAFFAKEPIMEPEIDIELGRMTAQSRVIAVKNESGAIGCRTDLPDQSEWERFKSVMSNKFDSTEVKSESTSLSESQ